MEIHLRPATREDSRLLFAWRNDGDTRRQSRHTGPIQWEIHEEWFSHALESDICSIVIAENTEGQPVGTVRADTQADGSVEISYTVAPQFRGIGVSKPMVRKFADEYLKEKRIVAHIKQGHIPSESVARMLGLQPVSEVSSDDQDDDRPMVEWR